MLKVKSFTGRTGFELESAINKFFQTVPEIALIDVKYAIVHEALATHSEHGVYPNAEHAALVIYTVS